MWCLMKCCVQSVSVALAGWFLHYVVTLCSFSRCFAVIKPLSVRTKNCIDKGAFSAVIDSSVNVLFSPRFCKKQQNLQCSLVHMLRQTHTHTEKTSLSVVLKKVDLLKHGDAGFGSAWISSVCFLGGSVMLQMEEVLYNYCTICCFILLLLLL